MGLSRGDIKYIRAFRFWMRKWKKYDKNPTIRHSAIIGSFLEYQRVREDDMYTGTSTQDITEHMRKFDKFADANYVKSELKAMPFVEIVARETYISGNSVVKMDRWGIVNLGWYEQRYRGTLIQKLKRQGLEEE